MADMKNIIEELQKYEPRSMHEHQLPVVWANAKNHRVWDIDGKEYIDFTSGIFVTNVGHGTVTEAIMKQSLRLIHCYTFPHMERLKLAKKLTEMTGFEKVFFMSAGTEATECAVKLMRMYTKKALILSFTGAMHGKTQLAEQLKGDYIWAEQPRQLWHITYPKPHETFEQSMFGFPYTDKVGGIIIESYRGWDAQFFSKKYIQDIVKWAKKNKIMVCFDEIQAGFGRTGKLFAYEHYGVKPDLVCCGKGLGGGVPISAVLGSAEVLDTPNDLSTTHSANPLCCAAALATLEYFDNNNLAKVANDKGQILEKELFKLMKYNCIEAINNQGMVAAVIFQTTKQADRVIFRAMKKGLLCVRTGRESIKIGPPLTIPVEAMLDGIKILEESIKCEKN
jgi:4-aminobutyrate aminotransferase-like enzyme